VKVLEGEKMIGAVVFLVSFASFTLISRVIDFPPGIWIYKWIPEIKQTEYAPWVNGIMNGVVYGVIIWLVFSLTKMAWERKKKKMIKGD
jgi:hypothetical protein